MDRQAARVVVIGYRDGISGAGGTCGNIDRLSGSDADQVPVSRDARLAHGVVSWDQ